jgi:hypothetical protein
MSLDSRGLGGSMRFTLQQIIEKSVGEEINGCYKVTSVTSDSINATVSKLKSDAGRVCVSQNPLTINLSHNDGNRELLSWTFSHLEPLRCSHCYVFRGGNEYSATFAATYAVNVFNLTLETRGFSGNVKMNLLKESDSQ